MKNLIAMLKNFLTLESDSLRGKILEVIVKMWMVLLFLIAVGGWLTVVIRTILNPHIWDNASFGVFDYI